MLDIFIYIAIGLALVIAAVLIYAATKPNVGRTARSIDIAAPPERIFPHIDNLKALNVWNPFVKTDPDMKGTYSGPPQGVGSAFAFDGNKNAGAGRIEIKQSVPSSQVTMNLVMIRPFACDNIVDFSLVPKGPLTTVTWAMTGPAPYFMRVMGTVFNMEKMMHGTFDKGLAELKAIVER